MDWKESDTTLKKNFQFDDFAKAIEFINDVANIAEQSNHHPDIELYNYNKVCIQTTTHSEGKVTDKDYHLAKRIDSLGATIS